MIERCSKTREGIMRDGVLLSLAALAALGLVGMVGCSEKTGEPGKTDNVSATPDNGTSPAPKKGVLERAGERTGEALKTGAEETGKALEKGAKATGKVLDKARQATGEAVKKTGEWILDNDTTGKK
jgi:hypothetical protein